MVVGQQLAAQATPLPGGLDPEVGEQLMLSGRAVGRHRPLQPDQPTTGSEVFRFNGVDVRRLWVPHRGGPVVAGGVDTRA